MKRDKPCRRKATRKDKAKDEAKDAEKDEEEARDKEDTQRGQMEIRICIPWLK